MVHLRFKPINPDCGGLKKFAAKSKARSSVKCTVIIFVHALEGVDPRPRGSNANDQRGRKGDGKHWSNPQIGLGLQVSETINTAGIRIWPYVWSVQFQSVNFDNFKIKRWKIRVDLYYSETWKWNWINVHMYVHIWRWLQRAASALLNIDIFFSYEKKNQKSKQKI